MAGIQSLFNEIQKIKDQIRDLNGRLQRIAVGGQVIPPSPGTASVPLPQEGAMIVGDAVPVWVRLPFPTVPSGETWVVSANDSDTQPTWRLESAGATGKYRMFTYTVNPMTPDFTFIIDGGGNPVFVLQDLE